MVSARTGWLQSCPMGNPRKGASSLHIREINPMHPQRAMEPLAAFLMIADFTLAVVFVALFHWLHRTGKIPLSYLYAFWIGTL